MAEPMLSAVICCYQDAQAIPVMHRRLTEVFRSLQTPYEIIFVNDCSPDDADSVLKGLTAADPHVLAVEHSRNFGSQNAFVSGMQLATGDAVILLDGDLQDPPELVAAFHAKWKEGYDVVYGRRVRREGSALLALLAKAFYRVFRGLSYVPIPVDAGDFALMDRKVVNQMLALPEADQFLRGLRAWVGYTQVGVDYVRPERAFGRSTHSAFKNLWWAKKAIFSFTFFPIELLGYAGGLMATLSFAAVVHQLLDYFLDPGGALGVGAILAFIAFFGSCNLVAVAIVGEYLIKVFEETKRRPKFIRKALRYGGKHLVSPREIEEFVGSRSRERPAAGSAEP